MRPDRLCPVAAGLLLIWTGAASADTIHFKNGHEIEGIVLSEDNDEVHIDLGQGKARFKKETIRRVERSDESETQLVLQGFEKEKAAAQEKTAAAAEAARKKAEAKEYEPKEIDVRTKDGQIYVKALLNGKHKATLLLDTGASNVLLSKAMAKKLGIKLKTGKTVLVEVADGRKVKAVPFIIRSLEVQGVTAKNVEGAVILKSPKSTGFEDGLLGMSFLGRFTFTIDKKNSVLKLEKSK